MSDLIHVTSTSTPVAVPCQVHSVILTAGADAATAVIRANGSGGVIKIKMAAALGTSAVWSAGATFGVSMDTNVHVTVTGTSPTVDLEVTR